jgi:isoleucyl-tRNA synthetase
MPFAKVETQNVDFPALEREVLAFWDAHAIFTKLREKNAGKPKWSFLDGPITANNPMGVHHAWNRTYKDAYNRYFAMTGHELRYQQGFDCQGLWVEVEVEKELQLKSKRDIENLVPGDRDASVAKFVQACKDRVNKYARMQTNQSIRLGYWMDWDRTDADWAKAPDDRKSYFTMAEGNNYVIWNFLKKCHDRKSIYRGYDAMPWCGRCGVGISEQEKAEGYKLIEHRAAFVKLPLTDRPNEYLLAWTTTPWTLTSNVAAAVNPKLTYLQMKLKGDIYYIAKGVLKANRMEGGTDGDEPAAKKSAREWLKDVPHLKSLEQIFKEKAGKDGFEIAGEVTGQQMLGWRYAGPFDDLPAQQSAFGYPDEVAKIVKTNGWCNGETGAAAHRVVDGGDDVTEGEGTGIVHTAPGCGGIDFQWGKANGLPPIAPLGEDGCFHDGFGVLSGRNAAEPATADVVFDELKKKDRLFAVERFVHKYPHCWRCKKELLYRLVDEWFINMDWRAEIAAVTEKVTFLPESVNGRARELDWLKNMGDWMISKKRYWGLALPIWVDDADPTQFEVIGSRAELESRAVEGWTEFDGRTPHRPYVDKIKIRNPRTGNLMSRVPDVGNPWLDAGVVAFSTMKWDTDRDYWRQWYPADFITESFPGQFRNWFYSLLAMSTMLGEGEPPFKTLLGFATVRDQFGKEMHKSEGNSIEFNGAANDGYELFAEIAPDKPAAEGLKLLPKNPLGTREELTTDRDGKPVRRVMAKYKAIGADVIRWLYCRHSPAQNINFGPEPTDEIRAKFLIKLWNVFALFCNYAAADGFDGTAAEVPVRERPAVDRWILSDLQELIATARGSISIIS